MVRAFAGGVADDARFFQQVRLHARAPDRAERVEAHLHELAEAAGVVVARGFRVAERLKRGVRREQNGLHGVEERLGVVRRHGVGAAESVTARRGSAAAEFRQAPQRDLGGFGFARAGFARHDERLVFPVGEHVAIRRHHDFVHVRVGFGLGAGLARRGFAHVLLDDRVPVQGLGDVLERVHRDQNRPRVRVHVVRRVPVAHATQDGRLVQVREACQVARLVQHGGVRREHVGSRNVRHPHLIVHLHLARPVTDPHDRRGEVRLDVTTRVRRLVRARFAGGASGSRNPHLRAPAEAGQGVLVERAAARHGRVRATDTRTGSRPRPAPGSARPRVTRRGPFRSYGKRR